VKLNPSTRDWLLKAALWISAEESFSDAFDALRTAKDEIRTSEKKLLQGTNLSQSNIYSLIETVVWTSQATNIDDIASNLADIFMVLQPGDFDSDVNEEHFGDSFYDCQPPSTRELSDFWNLRVDSAKTRGASSALHGLFDFVLRTVEIGLHPLQPDPVTFVVGEFEEDYSIEDPGISFIVEVFHRSARITLQSDQFVSLHENVIWVDDSSGRMGVVGGEPLPVIGQPEGDEPALRIQTDGEEMLQPFHSISLNDDEVDDHESD
jgi:hypothetical protein